MRYVADFLTIFGLVLITSAAVSYAYGLLVHGQGTADWGSAIRLAVIFAVVVTWIHARDRSNRE